jgi:outer membrane protein assembly factor BamA
MSAALSVFWLGWLNPRAQTRTGVGYYDEDEDAYASQEFRLELIQSFRPRLRDILNFGVALSDVTIQEKSDAYDEYKPDEGRLVEYWVESKWDRTNDPLFPTQGGYFKIYTVWSPAGIISESPYILVQGDAVRYPLRVGPIATAARVRVGWSRPLGDNAGLLQNRRFYAGGYNTMRGYNRRRLGPYDDDRNPIGGEFTALAGAEVRFPLFWILDGALFVDAGQVWAKPADAGLGELAVAVGAGIDFRTPIGPLRGGVARNVDNLIEGEPRTVWHFGIGYPW